MHAQVGDVETKAQTGMSVLQVVVAERFPGPGFRLPLKRGVRLWGGFSGVFLSSVSGPLHPLSATCSGASLPAVGSSPTLKLAHVFSESPTCLLLPMVSWQKPVCHVSSSGTLAVPTPGADGRVEWEIGSQVPSRGQAPPASVVGVSELEFTHL